jgi:hypothetical protein
MTVRKPGGVMTKPLTQRDEDIAYFRSQGWRLSQAAYAADGAAYARKEVAGRLREMFGKMAKNGGHFPWEQSIDALIGQLESSQVDE